MSTHSFLLISALLLGGYALVGCGNGQERQAETVSSSAAVAVDVVKSKQELDGVVSALKNMRDASDSADLKKLHADLAMHAKQLNDADTTVVASCDTAVAAGKSQQDAWHKQADAFTDAGLRTASQQREGNLRTAVEALSTARGALKMEGDAFQSLLSQTVSALDLDLTQSGVQTIKPTLSKLIASEPGVRRALTDVADQGRAVNTAINP